MSSNRECLFRLQTLIIDGGTEVIRNLFDQRIHGSALSAFLAKEKTAIKILKQQKTITKAQYDLLYPPPGQHPNSKNFDITLIICLLRNIPSLGLNQHYTWNVPPQPTDLCIEADLCRLKGFRNEIAHISSTSGFQQKSFNAKWNDIEQVFLRLNSTVPNPLPNLNQTIENYKYIPLDPGAELRNQNIIEQWRQMERGLETDIRMIKDDVNSIRKVVSVTSQDTKNIQQGVSDTKKDVKNIEQDVRDTKKDIKNTEQNVRDTKKDVKNIEQNVKGTKQMVKNIEQDVKETKQVVKNIEQDVRDTKKDVTNMEQAVRDTKQDVTNIKQNVKDTKQDVKNIEQDVRDTKENLMNIEQGVSDTKKNIKNIKQSAIYTRQGIKRTNKDVSDARKDIKKIKTCMSDSKQDVKIIKQQVDVIEKDIKDIKQGTPSKEDLENSYVILKSNLQNDLISFYERKHKSIPLSPLIKQDQPLLDFYVMPDIQSIKDSRSRDGYMDEKTPIRTLQDVFYRDNKLCSNVYVTADAGLGKTAFCKRLALMWCHSKKPNKTEKNRRFSGKEIAALCEFSFVFLVLLRDSSNECDIDMLIFNQLFLQLPRDYGLENLRKILYEEKCLIVLDGLDEWTHPLNACRQGKSHIPHRRVRENVVILTTTRPWKLGVSGLHSSQIDRQLELVGLSKYAATQLERAVISYLFEEQDEVKISNYVIEFNMAVNKDKMSDLTAIPLFLMYLLFLWYHKFSIGKSLTELYSSFIELLLSRTVLHHRQNAESVDGIIPPCFDNNTLCKQYYTLLTTLGELAFNTLFSETKENALVFDGCVAEKYLKKDLTFCLNTGIITQSKVQGTLLLSQKSKVSFAHKTVQEFLAALFICSTPYKSSVQEVLLSKIKRVEEILDKSNIFMFTVGMNLNSLLMGELRNIINENEMTQKYRSSLQDDVMFFKHPLKDLQDMYISCSKEITCGIKVDICLEDVFIDRDCRFKEYREYLKQLITRNEQNIRSLYIYMCHIKDTTDNTELNVIDFFPLSGLENVEKIHCMGDENCGDIIFPSLKCLSLTCAHVRNPWSQSLFDKVKSLQKLEVIRLNDFEMSHSDLSFLLGYISERDCLREIEHSGLYCTDHEDSCTGLSLDLSRHFSLRKLYLGRIKLSQVSINMSSLRNCYLKDLPNRDLLLKFLNCADSKLRRFHCSDLESSVAIDSVLDALCLSRDVREVHLSKIHFGAGTLKFSNDSVNIDTLDLHKVEMEASVLTELVDSVLKLHQSVAVYIYGCPLSNREEFETIKRRLISLPHIRILEDNEYSFDFETFNVCDRQHNKTF